MASLRQEIEEAGGQLLRHYRVPTEFFGIRHILFVGMGEHLEDVRGILESRLPPDAFYTWVAPVILKVVYHTTKGEKPNIGTSEEEYEARKFSQHQRRLGIPMDIKPAARIKLVDFLEEIREV